MDTLFIIFSVIMAIIVWVVYHNIFNVTYFGSGAIANELFGCLIVGAVIAALFVNFLPFIIIGGIVIVIITGVIKAVSK